MIYFQISIENDYLGPRRIESLQKEDADWQRKAHMAVLSIQDLTVKYFEITAKAQKGNGHTILHLVLKLSVYIKFLYMFNNLATLQILKLSLLFYITTESPIGVVFSD